MEIEGGFLQTGPDATESGAFYDNGRIGRWESGDGISPKSFGFKASRSWTGSTSDVSANHTHSFSTSWSDNLSMSGAIGNGNIETRPVNYTTKYWKRIS